MINDTAAGQTLSETDVKGTSARGYILMSLSSATTMTPLVNASSGQSVFIAPFSSTIVVRLELPLMNFYSSTTLKEIQSILQLLSSIAGFQNIVFSIFGMLFVFLIARSSESHAATALKQTSPEVKEKALQQFTTIGLDVRNYAVPGANATEAKV